MPLSCAAQPYEAGADKQPEDPSQAVLLDAVPVQLAGFVVDRAHEVFAGIGQSAREGEKGRHRLRQREHVIPKLLTGEGSVAVNHGAIQIIGQANLAMLKLVPQLKLFSVETKVFERLDAFGA